MSDERQINYKYFHWGPFLYTTKITDEDIKTLLDLSIEHFGKKDARPGLAGHLRDEYYLPNDDVMKVLFPYFDSYLKAYGEHWQCNLRNKIEMKSAWVNFMKKGEYNPPHIHFEDNDICAISCVLYLQIPKDMNKFGETTSGGPGCIMFKHGEYSKQAINQYSFVPEVGDFFIFPGSLEHTVAPFQCDGERISLSANLVEIKNEKEI